ncbi:MAG: hypothetical protein HY295_00125 [Thaumarchaeota archaeon]|nr:hypothetical protein [Nitrososphaerota archaeon]
MKASRIVIGIGIVILIFGIIFSLQGQAIVGPTTSFMYSNPEWITNGLWIAVAGAIILVAGIGISKIKTRF